jgi:hypothetical protein
MLLPTWWYYKRVPFTCAYLKWENALPWPQLCKTQWWLFQQVENSNLLSWYVTFDFLSNALYCMSFCWSVRSAICGNAIIEIYNERANYVCVSESAVVGIVAYLVWLLKMCWPFQVVSVKMIPHFSSKHWTLAVTPWLSTFSPTRRPRHPRWHHLWTCGTCLWKAKWTVWNLHEIPPDL